MNDGLFQDGFSESKAGSLLWYWIPPIACAAGIFYLSSLPHPEQIIPSFLELLGDKALHMVEYGVFGILCFRAFRHAGGPWAEQYALALAIVIAALYGVTDEIHQGYVPFRDASGWDVLADSVGACVATLTWRTVVDLEKEPAPTASDYQA